MRRAPYNKVVTESELRSQQSAKITTQQGLYEVDTTARHVKAIKKTNIILRSLPSSAGFESSGVCGKGSTGIFQKHNFLE